jgi:hypothetical protein
VSRDLPCDYEVDLQAFVQDSDTKIGDYSDEDKVIKNARINNNKVY